MSIDCVQYKKNLVLEWTKATFGSIDCVACNRTPHPNVGEDDRVGHQFFDALFSGENTSTPEFGCVGGEPISGAYSYQLKLMGCPMKPPSLTNFKLQEEFMAPSSQCEEGPRAR